MGEDDKTIEADKEDDNKVKCTMCEKNWKLISGTNIYMLRKSIKNHICKTHFEVDMSELLKYNFKDNSCQLCDSKIVMEIQKKNHLQEYHGVFNDILAPMLKTIIGNNKDQRKRKTKTEKVASRQKKLKLDSDNLDGVTKLMVESPSKTATTVTELDNIEDSADFKELQSCIDYSDSDSDDDETEAIFNAIQNSIEYSDSDEEE